MYTSSPKGGLLRSNNRSESGGTPRQIRSSSQSGQSSLEGELRNSADGKTISMTYMDEYIGDYAKYRDTQIDSLEPNIKQRLVVLGNIFATLRESTHYPRILELVKKHFGSSSTVQPGTVGNFFYGCFTPSNYNGPIHCSANCAGNVVPPDGPGYEACSDSVYYLKADGTLDPRIKTSSKKAIIHVLTPAFTGLSHAQVNELRQNGTEMVDIYLVSADFKHTTISENIPLSEIQQNFSCPDGNCGKFRSLPPADSGSGANNRYSTGSLPNGKPVESASGQGAQYNSHVYTSPGSSQTDSNGGHQHGHGQQQQQSNYAWVGAVIFIIIVIIIVLILFAAYGNRRRLDDPEPSLGESAGKVMETVDAVDSTAFWSGYGSAN